MRPTSHLAPFIVLLCVSLCLGCSGVSKKVGKVGGKVFSPVTSVVKGTANRIKGVGSGMADDTREYSTRLFGVEQSTLTPSQKQAIANYERKKRYEQNMRQRDLDSRLVPDMAKVNVIK
ncbi:MAG TPA: hypothetical protein PLZ55_08115 [bacterium]|nr:hypothetical protein [bacterium]HPO08618.1 hypothetical protein [bacterium]HQO35651.1 hypothetical protein [bacterium]HQP97382.1 hypothetical protein [bacterium]